jgi:membrane fusion protein, multidrug efflux system
MTKRMIIMLLVAGLVFGGIFGFQAFKGMMIKKYFAGNKPPPAVVTTLKAELQTWQPQISAVGSLRAHRGVDVTTEIAGLVRKVNFVSGSNVREGDLLIELNADSDIAQLHALQAAADLAGVVYQRDKAQFEAEAISQAVLDVDAADLKGKKALVEQQAAAVAKKMIRAPFSGRLGITIINPGQYLNPGDKIVTLQELDPIYIDFSLPQQQVSRLIKGLKVAAITDSYPGHKYDGHVQAVDPKIDASTRNVQVTATLANPQRELLPGMFATANIESGGEQRFITLPQTAVSFNPYGATVYIVQDAGKEPAKDAAKDSGGKSADAKSADGKGADAKPGLIAKQSFVVTGETRGDQVQVLSGVKVGDVVVTSGQLKLHNGSEIIVNNKVQPANDAAPVPVDQ